jgi:hypothetical protein
LEGSELVHWKGLGEKISQILRTFTVTDIKLALANSISNPVKPGVDALCALGFERVVS